MPLVQAGPVKLDYDEAGSGDDIAVLVHGASSSHRQWATVQRHLAEAGVHSYAISMRGAGASDRGASEADYAPASYARDLAAAVDILGLRRFTLVGHSLGTLVSRYYVRDHAERVRALALIAGPDPSRPGLTPEQRATRAARPTASRPGDSAPPEAWTQQHMGLDDAQRAALWRDILNNPPERARGQESPWPGLEGCAVQIPVHTLVMLGDADDVVPPADPLRGYLELAPERRHLHVFTGVGHFPPAQIPDRTAGVLVRFMRAHAKPA
ncbi:MAG: alpha/beta hydrolase [Dehalococcoidia bacterium]|nr:MAG: alpha/beta hydrolase [Dehalococcoidia bacterium]